VGVLFPKRLKKRRSLREKRTTKKEGQDRVWGTFLAKEKDIPCAKPQRKVNGFLLRGGEKKLEGGGGGSKSMAR